MAAEAMTAQALQLETVDELLAKRLLTRGLNRGASSRQFDKGGLARWHMAAAREYRRMVEECPVLPRIFHVLEKDRDAQSSESLEKIDISGLDMRVAEREGGVVHLRQALYGRLCVPAFKTANVHTVLEDSTGRAVPVLIQNAAAAADYPLGMEVAIKQPWVTTLTRPDRCVGVMVDNPAHVLDVNALRVSADTERNAGFSEHIGPVTIGIGRDEHNRGRRGLFATRDVRAGELVLVSKALAAVEEKKEGQGDAMWGLLIQSADVKPTTPLSERLVSSPLQEMVAKLARLMQQHPRCAHQLFSLAVADAPTTEIPCMDLFDPRRDWKCDPLVVDVSRIRRAILTNAFSTKDALYGLWALPSFLNHGCDPNCTVRYEGDVQVIQAYSYIGAGQELATTYFDIDRTWFYRQKKARKWGFTCSCPRCHFEEGLSNSTLQFMDLSRQWHQVYEAHLPDLDGTTPMPQEVPLVKGAIHSSTLRKEVENMLDHRCADMTSQQKHWIQTSFSRSARAYCSSSSSSEFFHRYGRDSARRHGTKVSVVRTSFFRILLPRSLPLLLPHRRLWRLPAGLS